MTTTAFPRLKSVALALAAGTAVLATGCLRRAASDFYVLRSQLPAAATAAADAQPATAPLHLQAVSVPRYLDNPAMILNASDYRLRRNELNRWGEPLADGVARVLAENLGGLTGQPVTTDFRGNVPASHAVILQVRVLAFEPRGKEAVCELQWAMTKPGQPVVWKSSKRTAPLSGHGPVATVAALSQLLAEFSQEVAAADRAAPPPPPAAELKK